MPKKISNQIENFYELPKVQKFIRKAPNPNYENHKIKLPFRSAILGSSGSGKTHTLCNIIYQFGKTFNHIYIYTKAEETLYDFLTEQLDDSLLTIVYNDLDRLRQFKDDEYYGQSLIIFDDMVNEKDQRVIQELYIRGRKLNISLIYLSQSYYKIPKIIRGQISYIFIIKIAGLKDLRLILSEYELTANKIQLSNMYKFVCKSGNFGHFFLIDLEAKQDDTYRKNFDIILNPNEFN